MKFYFFFFLKQGARAEKRSSKKIRKEIAQNDYHRVPAKPRGHVKQIKSQETVKHSNTRAKPAAPIKIKHGQPRAMEKNNKKAKSNKQRSGGLNKLKMSNLNGSPFDILCQIISFINKLLNLNFLRLALYFLHYFFH